MLHSGEMTGVESNILDATNLLHRRGLIQVALRRGVVVP
jgi:hypothetical protein